MSLNKRYRLIARIVLILGTVISALVTYFIVRNLNPRAVLLFYSTWIFARFWGVTLLLYLILRIAARIFDCYDKLNRKLSIILAKDKDATEAEEPSTKKAFTKEEESDPYEFYKPPKDWEDRAK